MSNPYREKAEQSYKQGVSPVTTGVLIVFHLMSLLAVFTFSWRNLVVALVLHWMAVGLGISMGYHRLHTHRGFKTFRLFDYFLAVCGTLTLEGGPIFWVATHRLHHQYSDKPEDPHSPRVSGFWAHAGWIIFGEAQHDDTARLARYAPDLNKDAFYRWLSAWHWVPLTVLGLGLLAWGGWGMVIWAIFLRVTVGLHATWMINSATHIFGSRRFNIDDDSKNVWWVALLTFGEGWHNNHHAHPVSAKHGLAWYEFDWTWVSLKLLSAFGIVWDLKVAKIKGLEEAAA